MDKHLGLRVSLPTDAAVAADLGFRMGPREGRNITAAVPLFTKVQASMDSVD
jgi:hypothetical protein